MALKSDQVQALRFRLSKMGARILSVPSRLKLSDISDERVLAMAGEHSRDDFELAYVLVDLMARNASRFHPFLLRREISQMPSPHVWGVVFEFVKKICIHSDIESFSRILLKGTSRQPFAFYARAASKLSSYEAQEIRRKSPLEFRKWGFYCKEVPIFKDLDLQKKKKHYPVEVRFRILKRLFAQHGRIQMSEYMAELDSTITRQQAHRDLVTYPGVRFISDKRGRRYAAG